MDSPFTLLKRHWPIALIALLFGVYGWALVLATGSGHDGAIGPRFNALGADWVIFLAAARAFFTGDLAHIYNQGWITQATNSQFTHWLSAPLPFPLFPYPPVFLLLVLPFAKLPVELSLLLSQLMQFAALAFALQRLAPGKSYFFFLVGAFLCPAAANNVLAGSNAVLVAALIISGMALLDTKPLVAGALLGVVIFKPQFFPLLPLALIAAKQGRALAGMMACIAILMSLSAALFGPALWLDWFNIYLQPQQVAGVNGTDWGHSWDESISTCVSLLGAPHWAANLAQGLGAVIAVASVWRAFRTAHPQRLAVLLCAVLLASPHVSNYDLLLAAIAALLAVRAMPESSRPLALMLPLAAWLAPLYNPPRALLLGLVTPWVIAGLIWALFAGFSGQKPLHGKG
jgi:hypothetical protein